MPAQWLIETGDGEALPLWSQAVLGVGGALLLACTLFICYVRTRVGGKCGCTVPFAPAAAAPRVGSRPPHRQRLRHASAPSAPEGGLPTPRCHPSGKREMKNTPIWSNLETIQQVAPMPSDQVGTANYAVAAVSRVKPACELTPAVSQSNTERSQGDMSLHS